MKAKRFITVVLSLVLCLAVAVFAACRPDNSSSGSSSGSGSSGSTGGGEVQTPVKVELEDSKAVITGNVNNMTLGDAQKVIAGEQDLAVLAFGNVTVGELVYSMINATADTQAYSSDGSASALTPAKFALYDDGNWYIESLSPQGEVIKLTKFNAFTSALFRYKLTSLFKDEEKLDIGSQTLRVEGERKAVDVVFENFYPALVSAGGAVSGSAIIKQAFAQQFGVENSVVNWLCDLTVSDVYAMSGGDYSACGDITVGQIYETAEFIYAIISEKGEEGSQPSSGITFCRIALAEVYKLLGADTKISEIQAKIPEIKVYAVADSFAVMAKALDEKNASSADVIVSLVKLSFGENDTLGEMRFIGGSVKVADYINAVATELEKSQYTSDKQLAAELKKLAAVFGDSTVAAPTVDSDKLTEVVKDVINSLITKNGKTYTEEQVAQMVTDVTAAVKAVIDRCSASAGKADEKISAYVGNILVNIEKFKNQAETASALDVVLAFAGTDSKTLSAYLFGAESEANLVKDLAAITVAEVLDGTASKKIAAIDATHAVDFVRAVLAKGREVNSEEFIETIRKAVAHLEEIMSGKVVEVNRIDAEKFGAFLDKVNEVLVKEDGTKYTLGELPAAIKSLKVADAYELVYLFTASTENDITSDGGASSVKKSEILEAYKNDVLYVVSGTVSNMQIDYDKLAEVIAKYIVDDRAKDAEAAGTPLTEEQIAALKAQCKVCVKNLIDLVLNFSVKDSPDASELITAYLTAHGEDKLLDTFLAPLGMTAAQASEILFGELKTNVITELAGITVNDLFGNKAAEKVLALKVSVILDSAEVLYKNTAEKVREIAKSIIQSIIDAIFGPSEPTEPAEPVPAVDEDVLAVFALLKTTFADTTLAGLPEAISALSVENAYDIAVAVVKVSSDEKAATLKEAKADFVKMFGGTLGNVTFTYDEATVKKYVETVINMVIGSLMPEIDENGKLAMCKNYVDFVAAFVKYVSGDKKALDGYYLKYGKTVTIGELDAKFGGLLAKANEQLGGMLGELMTQQLANVAYAVKAFYEMPSDMKKEAINKVITQLREELVKMTVADLVEAVGGKVGLTEEQVKAVAALAKTLFKGTLGNVEIDYDAKISEIVKNVVAVVRSFNEKSDGGNVEGGEGSDITEELLAA